MQHNGTVNENKRLVLKGKGLYLFAFIAVTAIFASHGQNIYAEIVAEFMKYSLGEKISGSFAGYITIFPIGIAYLYYYLLKWTNISWFEFSAFISYIYTLLCTFLVVKVLKDKLDRIQIIIVMISMFALLSHPSVAALINITHFGYIPVIIYIITCIFGHEFIDQLSDMPKILFVPLLISVFSKPSFSCVIFIVVLLLTRVYKKPITFVALVFSSGMSLFQMILYSHGSVGLKIDSISAVLKFIYIFIQSIGSSILFLGTFYIEGQIPKYLLILSMVIGVSLILCLLYMFIKEITYKNCVSVILLGSVLVVAVMPYIMINCNMPLKELVYASAKLCFSKYKLQYQLTSTILMSCMLVFLIGHILKSLKIKNLNIKSGIFFMIFIFSLNGLFSGIYSGRMQTVNPIKGNNLKYNSEEVFLYPPLPDWDWEWSDKAVGGWIKGNSYSKYDNKPQEFGAGFKNLNKNPLPEVKSGKIFIMLSDPNIHNKSATNYLNTFNKEERQKRYNIGDLNVSLSRATNNGIRYGVIDYSNETVTKLFEQNLNISSEDGNLILDSSNVNFIIVY